MKKPLLLAQSVMIQHTLFSLPFALSAILLETKGNVPAAKLGWILLAIIGARNGANALNRLIDHAYDGKNPRTAKRHLPSGLLKRADLIIFATLCIAVLIFSTFRLNALCVSLLPVALVMVFSYSYTKRFTWLCHYFLGLTVAIAPMGALLAITGAFKLPYFFISGAVALWVAGFDIIYATQDIAFDRKEGLHSVPARFGEVAALRIAFASHMVAWLLFAVWGWLYGAGLWFFVGCAVTLILLIVENRLVSPGEHRHVEAASYHLNEIISVLFLCFVLLEVYLP